MANRKNPYIGVNAHLNSLLQTPGTDEQPSLWQSFHTMHIGDIARHLNAVLPDNYIALAEISLQSKTAHSDIIPEDLSKAVVIRQISQQTLGSKPVVRIELLSPNNKSNSSDYATYWDKRLEALQGDVPVIELDYLHETRSPIHMCLFIRISLKVTRILSPSVFRALHGKQEHCISLDSA